MVYRIYLVKVDSEFKMPVPRIINIQEFANGQKSIDLDDLIENGKVIDYFEFSVNFDDLNIFDIQKQLHKQSVSNVIKKIHDTLQNLLFKEYKIGVPEKDNRRWIWGHQNTIGIAQPFPDDVKVSILMYHLVNLQTTLKDHDSKNANLQLLVYDSSSF